MSWQHLKETLAHFITNHCHCYKHLQCLHARAISSGLRRNLYISSLLITKYFCFSSAKIARQMFDELRCISPTKTLLFNSLIRGYLQIGDPKSAIEIYHESRRPDERTFQLVITACTDMLDFELGSQVEASAHAKGFCNGLIIGTALVNMYCKAGNLVHARNLFDKMFDRDVVLWNTLISGYVEAGCFAEACKLFEDMTFVYRVQPTEATFVSLLVGCGNSSLLKCGEVLHAHVIKVGYGINLYVSNALMEMYIDCNCLDLAERLFNMMACKDSVSWSTMIGGYRCFKRSRDAVKLFQIMVSRAEVPLTRPVLLNTLLACADLGDWMKGKDIETKYIAYNGSKFQSDVSLITALIYLYTKCGKMENCLKLLNDFPKVGEDVVAWNTMIKASAELKDVDRVLTIYLEMQRSAITPNKYTFMILLPLVSFIPCLKKGIETHAHVIKRGFEPERVIVTFIIEMYGKCGRIEDADKLFVGITNKDVVSWSLMIKVYALNGNAQEALNLFELMKANGIVPNEFTFLAILSACSHGGFVEQGKKLFSCMKEEYGLEPSVEHICCIVDLVSRAGFLNDAYKFLLKNIVPGSSRNAALWGSLLSACRYYGNTFVGEVVARKMFSLEPENAANYMMLADIYVSGNRRADANDILWSLEEQNLDKVPAWSWLEGA